MVENEPLLKEICIQEVKRLSLPLPVPPQFHFLNALEQVTSKTFKIFKNVTFKIITLSDRTSDITLTFKVVKAAFCLCSHD